MAHSIPYFFKLYKFPFLVGAALTISSVYVYTQLQVPAAAPLPPVPKEQTISHEKKTAKAIAPEAQPRRDPFRPLNHPIYLEKKPVEEKIPVSPSRIPPENLAVSPAPAAPLSYRFSGIITVDGHKKVLVTTPNGSLLAGEGDALPGKGTIQSITGNTLQCRGETIPLGERWS